MSQTALLHASGWNRCVPSWPAGKRAYLAGLGIAGHNSGAALVEVSERDGVRLLSNDEEERFTGVKHFGGYPEQSIESLKQRLASMGLGPRDLHAVLLSWNYIKLDCFGVQSAVEHFPGSLALARKMRSRSSTYSKLDRPCERARNGWRSNSGSTRRSR